LQDHTVTTTAAAHPYEDATTSDHRRNKKEDIMARNKQAKKGNSLSVDFTGVDMSGSTGFHIPEGSYGVKVKSIEQTVSKNDNDQLKWVFTGTEGKAKNKTFFYYTPLTPESLWKLGLALKALGQDVPDSTLDIDLDELIDLECSGNVIDDEYEGKTRSKLQSLDPIDEPPAKETASAKTASKENGKKKTVIKLEESEVKDMSEDELEELNEKHELGVDFADHKTLRRKAAAVVAALEENDLLSA
jgi:hypothetical protein